MYTQYTQYTQGVKFTLLKCMGYWMIMTFSRDLTQNTMTCFSGLKKETWSVWEWLGSPPRQSRTNCSSCSGTKVSYLCVLVGLRYVSRSLLVISFKKDHLIQISWTQDAFMNLFALLSLSISCEAIIIPAIIPWVRVGYGMVNSQWGA